MRKSKLWPGLAALAMFAATGCAPLPEGTERDDLEFFEEAVASIDCELVKSADYATVQFQAGLTREQVLEFAGYELSTERAVRLESGGIRLVAGPCAPGAQPAATPVAVIAAA